MRLLCVPTGGTLAALMLVLAPPAIAQDATAGPPQPAADETTEHNHPKFLDRFYRDEDGKIDFSKILAKDGFIPVPVIVTEPAVDGGFGLIAQFITVPPDDPTQVTRRIAGGVKTGNGSYDYGYFQSGHALDGRISYKFGVGQGKITLTARPALIPDGVEYTNKYKYGVLGSALWHLGDRRFSFGPSVDFRKLKSRLDFENLPDDLASRFDHTLKIGALGFGFHFDSRDNPITPTEGANVYVEGKFNSDAFGSDPIMSCMTSISTPSTSSPRNGGWA